MDAAPPSAPRSARLDSAREISRLLDTAFKVPGTRFRFGLDPVLGIIPGVGDVVGGSFAAYLIWVGVRLGAPASVLFRMVLNVGIDAVFGAIPLLGDVADAAYKANVRNLALLERYAHQPDDIGKRSKVLLLALLAVVLLMLVASAWFAITLIGWLLSPAF